MITWRDAMSVGSPALDADHKKLIELLNLAENWVGRESWPQVGAVITDLLAYVRDHFAREEAIQIAIRYPEAESHKHLHEQLSRRASVLAEKFRAAVTDDERRTCGNVLVKVLTDWLVDHILKQDMRFKPLIPKKAPPPPALDEIVVPAAPSEAEMLAERRARREARERDIEYQLPPHLAHLLKRLDYVVPQPPEPAKGFDSFEKLCEAAICRRVDKVLIFFQRHNPALYFEVPPVFLFSAEFADKFRQAITKFIFPIIWNSRQIKLLATSFAWEQADTDSFWDHITKPLEQCILQGWTDGWDDLRLVATRKSDGSKIMQVKENTKELRDLLLPSDPLVYDIPKIGNREIEVFKSLLDPTNDWWDHLNRSWRICHDLYEQEKDPRIFQQKARDGAFRDGLLAVFSRFPPQWADFMVLACHRVFPRITTGFLESFSASVGTSDAQREEYIPYTLDYLRQTKALPEIKARERAEEMEWQARMKDLGDYLAQRPKKE